MKCFKFDDADTIQLSGLPDQFNLLLKTYLIPLGWELVEETNHVLYIKNAFGNVLKCDNQQSSAVLQGFRSISEIHNNQKSFPTQIQSSTFVTCEIENDFNWILFATDSLFYFILNSELYGFGTFLSLYFENKTDCFLLGKSTNNSTQKLFTNLGIFETSNLSVAANTIDQIAWSTPISFSYDQRIDVVKNTTNNYLPISVISVHETRTNALRGVLPGVFVMSSKVTLDLNEISTIVTSSNIIVRVVSINNKLFAFEIS